MKKCHVLLTSAVHTLSCSAAVQFLCKYLIMQFSDDEMKLW